MKGWISVSNVQTASVKVWTPSLYAETIILSLQLNDGAVNKYIPCAPITVLINERNQINLYL